MNTFENTGPLSVVIKQVKYEDNKNARFSKDKESSKYANNNSNNFYSNDENENQFEDGNDQYNNKNSTDLYHQLIKQQNQLSCSSIQMPHRPKNLGYQSNDNGYQSNDNGYQSNDNGFQSNNNGFQSNDNGYASNQLNISINQVSQNIYQNNLNNHNTYQSKENNFQTNLPNQSSFLFDTNNSEMFHSDLGNYQSTTTRFVQNSTIHQQFLNILQPPPIGQLQNQFLYQHNLGLQPQQQQSKQYIPNQNHEAKKEEHIKNLCSFYLVSPSKFSQEAQKMIFLMNQTKFIEEYFRYLTQYGDTKQKRDILIGMAKILNREKLIAKNVFFKGYVIFESE